MDLTDIQATALMVQWALKDKANALNQALLSDDALDMADRKQLRLQTQEFLQLLHDLREQVAGTRMQALVQQHLQWNEPQTAELVDQIEQLHTFGKKLTQALASATIDPNHFSALRQTPAWRKLVKGNSTPGAEGYFAPLLNFIANEASPALKAEWTARIELYIQSGWAQRDCLSEDPNTLSPSAKALRTLMQQLNAGALITNTRALNICSARFEELFVGCTVKNITDVHGEVYPVAHFEGAGVRMDTTVRSGGVDVVIPNAQNPSHLHVAVVTSDESTVIENTQLLRHHKALSDALGAPGSAYQSMQLAFYVPCMLYEADQEQLAGRAIGAPLLASTQTPMTDHQRQALNVLPFIATLGRVDRTHPHLDIGALSTYDLHLIGARADGWNGISASVRTLPEPMRREAFLAQCCATVGTSIEALTNKALDGTLLSARGSTGKVLQSLCEALEGIHHHGIAYPQLLDSLQPQVQRLALFGTQITSDSAIRRRLDSIVDTHEFPGGVSAWAQVQVNRAARSAAQLQTLQTERLADIAGTAQMVQEQALVQHLSKEHAANRALRAAIEEDTQTALGLSRHESAALQEAVRLKTLRQVAPAMAPVESAPESAQHALNERLRRACTSDNIDQINQALLDGAHLEARDPQGKSLADLAAAHKATRAHTHLEQLLAARCMDDLAKDVQHRQALRRAAQRTSFGKSAG
jgi:hypothetical protein